jgi:hypothetical protein
MGKIRRGHSNCGCGGYRKHHFFIGHLMAVNEKRQKQLIEHYKRISDNVFKAWSMAVPTLGSTAGTLPPSFMPLYTNIVSIIKSPGRYHEAKSHLGASYWHVNRILNDIELRAENHNQQVASLIITLNSEIIDTIHNNNQHRPCNIAVNIHKYNVLMASDPPWYNIDCIYGHFREEANHNHGKLTVVPGVDENSAVLRRMHKEGTFENLALGTEDDMNCLMQIVMSFQGSMVPQLRTLIANGIEINAIFNETLKRELAPIMRYIEDGHLD